MSGWGEPSAGTTPGYPTNHDFSGFSNPESTDADEAAEAGQGPEAPDPLSSALRERDDYLDALRHLQADFENYKKRMQRQQLEHLERAAESLVVKLLPVLDTADLALAHGAGEEVRQISVALSDVLQRQGLSRIDTVPAKFDPTVHDAVSHDPVEEEGEPEVIEVMRAGYLWNGRVLRPAMVRVRG